MVLEFKKKNLISLPDINTFRGLVFPQLLFNGILIEYFNVCKYHVLNESRSWCVVLTADVSLQVHRHQALLCSQATLCCCCCPKLTPIQEKDESSHLSCSLSPHSSSLPISLCFFFFFFFSSSLVLLPRALTPSPPPPSPHRHPSSFSLPFPSAPLFLPL